MNHSQRKLKTSRVGGIVFESSLFRDPGPGRIDQLVEPEHKKYLQLEDPDPFWDFGGIEPVDLQISPAAPEIRRFSGWANPTRW